MKHLILIMTYAVLFLPLNGCEHKPLQHIELASIFIKKANNSRPDGDYHDVYGRTSFVSTQFFLGFVKSKQSNPCFIHDIYISHLFCNRSDIYYKIFRYLQDHCRGEQEIKGRLYKKMNFSFLKFMRGIGASVSCSSNYCDFIYKMHEKRD